MLPMMDIGGLVDGMPEANRRRAVDHERFSQAMVDHEVRAGERVPGVLRRLATWMVAQLAGGVPHQEPTETARRR